MASIQMSNISKSCFQQDGHNGQTKNFAWLKHELKTSEPLFDFQKVSPGPKNWRRAEDRRRGSRGRRESRDGDYSVSIGGGDDDEDVKK